MKKITSTPQKKFPYLIYHQSEYVGNWVAERIADVYKGFDRFKAIGVMSPNENRLICGVVYTDYHPWSKTMQLHFASDTWMWARKEIIHDLLAYPFVQLGIYKCWICIASDNVRSLKTTNHIGFDYEATLKHQFGQGRHGIIGRMLKPDFERIYGGKQ